MEDVKPGNQTSEFKLARIVTYAGAYLAIAGVVLTALSAAGIGASWVGPAIIVVGALMKVAVSLGYSSDRADVKQAALAADAAPVSVAQLLPANPSADAIHAAVGVVVKAIGDAAAARVQTDAQAIDVLKKGG